MRIATARLQRGVGADDSLVLMLGSWEVIGGREGPNLLEETPNVPTGETVGLGCWLGAGPPTSSTTG